MILFLLIIWRLFINILGFKINVVRIVVIIDNIKNIVVFNRISNNRN